MLHRDEEEERVFGRLLLSSNFSARRELARFKLSRLRRLALSALVSILEGVVPVVASLESMTSLLDDPFRTARLDVLESKVTSLLEELRLVPLESLLEELLRWLAPTLESLAC